MSEYGSGVVVCLAKFSEHLHPQVWERYEEISGISHAIEMAMNGASDHFYDLDREKAPKPLVELADLALEMGHGFTSNKKWTEKDLERVRDLWRQSCLAVDEMLGVKGDWGDW